MVYPLQTYREGKRYMLQNFEQSGSGTLWQLGTVELSKLYAKSSASINLQQ